MPRYFAAILMTAAACGGGGASATFTGTVHGQSMRPSDAISSPATVSFASGTVPVAAIIIADAGTLCTKLAANLEPKSSRALILFLADVNGATGTIEAPSGTGTWTIYTVGSGVPPAHFAVATFGVNDASCNQIAAQSAAAVSGSVTLTANGGGAYAGTFDLLFDSGDRVQGAFHTATCQGLATFLASPTHGCG
jgi:hypothetical protein